MMCKALYIRIGICLLAIIGFISSDAGTSDQPAPTTNGTFSICDDDSKACISFMPEGCVDCPSAKQVKLHMENLMKTLDKWFAVLTKSVEGGVFENIKPRTDGIQAIAGRIPTMLPKKFAAKSEEFNQLASALGSSVEALVKAADSKDATAMKTSLKPIGNACSSCHQKFR